MVQHILPLCALLHSSKYCSALMKKDVRDVNKANVYGISKWTLMDADDQSEPYASFPLPLFPASANNLTFNTGLLMYVNNQLSLNLNKMWIYVSNEYKK